MLIPGAPSAMYVRRRPCGADPTDSHVKALAGPRRKPKPAGRGTAGPFQEEDLRARTTQPRAYAIPQASADIWTHNRLSSIRPPAVYLRSTFHVPLVDPYPPRRCAVPALTMIRQAAYRAGYLRQGARWRTRAHSHLRRLAGRRYIGAQSRNVSQSGQAAERICIQAIMSRTRNTGR